MKKHEIIWYIRPIIHYWLIMIVFYFMYKLRLYTDLIPLTQLPIPYMEFNQTIFFGFLSASMFIFIWRIKWLYIIDKPLNKYFSLFTKTWIYWIISITFIFYFGTGFLRESWVSRFMLVMTGFIWYFILFFIDQIINYFKSRFDRISWKQILIITEDKQKNIDTIGSIAWYYNYPTKVLSIDNIKNPGKNYMIFVLWNYKKNDLQNLFESIRFTDTYFYHISEGQFLEDVTYKPEYVASIVALEYKHSKLDWWSLIFKRIFDIIWSFIGLIILCPLFIVVWIIIRLDTKGPVFYHQKRVWKNEKKFTFYKFRTMKVEYSIWENFWWNEAEELYEKLINSKKNIRWNILPKIENDPRVTRFWKILRKTSVDELPSLICVLMWSMSLVWPRPHLPNEVAKYEHRQKRLFSIKPWITGYAQCFGRDENKFTKEAKLDLYYIQNWSIFLDLYVIFATFKVVFKWK